ncbi:DUF2142 domain-containing protein [Nocardia noduli]|uniref:DUF2142 domain-containing protein n=1 Tax=Nocardia noduli TaxID=2815722 RepID=UPI001C233D70|nr:DUF2142 domain-containing protein [Nocardia noduli]
MTTSADPAPNTESGDPASETKRADSNGNGAERSDAQATGTTKADTTKSEAVTAPPTSRICSGIRRSAQRYGAPLVARFGAATLAFTLIAGIFGALFAVVTPPFWGHDEITQFGRAYQVAHGGVLPQRIDDTRGVAYGGDVPVSVTELMGYALRDYTSNPQEPDPMIEDPAVYDRLKDAAVGDTVEPVWFTNTAAYSPVPYLPAALGIRVAEVTGLDVGGLVLLTRLAGLLAYLAVVGFALWTLRAHRMQWLAFAVAVLPIAVFQAGTVTADTLTNALAILASVLLVKGLFLGERLRGAETAALLAATVLLPVSKPTYVLLAMLIVVVPADRFGFTGPRRWIPWGFAAAGALSFAVWMKIAAPTGDGMGLMRPEHQWKSVRPGDQLSEILGDLPKFVSTFGDSVVYRDQRWFTQFFGELGFAYIDVPAISVLACLLAFAVSVGIAERMNTATATTRRTVIVALTVAASVAMIYVTLYMSFTPVGYYIIDGVQGRYFVPLAILGVAVLLRWISLRLTDSEGRTPTWGPAVTVIAASTVALIAALAKYHAIVWG